MIAGVGAEFECFVVAVIEMLRRTWSHWPQAPARLEAEEEEKEGGHASGGLLGPEGLAAPSGGEVAEWRSGEMEKWRSGEVAEWGRRSGFWRCRRSRSLPEK
jgi:hypothetical protein